MKITIEIPSDGVLAVIRHPNGTGTRLDTYVDSGTGGGKRGRRWVVGYGVDARGVAMRGANCHKTLKSAIERFVVEVLKQERHLPDGRAPCGHLLELAKDPNWCAECERLSQLEE